MKGPKKSPKE